MVSEHGLTITDYKDLKTVEDSLKTTAPQIETKPTIQTMDKSQDEQRDQSAVISDAVHKENTEPNDVHEVQISPSPASTRDIPSNGGHVNVEKNPDEPLKISLANRCTFKCNKCVESFGSWRELRAHVGKMHNQRYIKCNFNEYAVATVSHVCTVCKAMVLQDYDAIRLHMLTHGIKNLEDYTKVSNKQEMEKVDSNEKSLENMEAETILKHSDSADTTSSMENKVSKEKKKATSGRRIPSIRLRDVVKDGVRCNDVNYSNKCKFRCVRCGYKSSAWKELRRHVSRNHLSLFEKGFELNPFEYATVRNFHECRVCGERLLHDAWIITSHNLKQHKRLKLREVTDGNTQNDSDPPNEGAEEEDKENAVEGSESENEILGKSLWQSIRNC